MSILPIHSILKSDAAVRALINPDVQIFEDIAPNDTPQPYVVWQALSGNANNNLDCPANFDDVSYQVMVYAKNPAKAYEVREAVRKALEKHSWINNPSINSYESSTRLYVRGFDADWILER